MVQQRNGEIPQVTDHQIGLLRSAARRLARGSNDAGLMHRLDIVLLLIQQLGVREIAHWFGESERTIERWRKRFHEKGIDGLKNIRHSGRPSRIPPDVLRRLHADLASPPAASGFPVPEWRGRLVQRHLKARYGIAISLRQAQRLLHGFHQRQAKT